MNPNNTQAPSSPAPATNGQKPEAFCVISRRQLENILKYMDAQGRTNPGDCVILAGYSQNRRGDGSSTRVQFCFKGHRSPFESKVTPNF